MNKTNKWGVVPFRLMRDGKMEVLVITTRNDNWGLPKGNLIKRLGPRKTALREAFEEAGALGRLVDGKGVSHREKGGVLRLYPMQVSHLLLQWPEDSRRERRWVKPDKAVKMIKNKAMRRAVESLAARRPESVEDSPASTPVESLVA